MIPARLGLVGWAMPTISGLSQLVGGAHLRLKASFPTVDPCALDPKFLLP
jgi:hypothetical protein